MKTIGLLGGMSWESTQIYYAEMNRRVREKRGGHEAARILLFSANFAEIRELTDKQGWNAVGEYLGSAAVKLEEAGADMILMATNTIHVVADQIQNDLQVPFLHIATPLIEALKKDGRRKVALLGTQMTMESTFYRELLEVAGFEVWTPSPEDRGEVHRIIFDELTLGEVSPAAQDFFRALALKAQHAGAEGVILGCTELGLVLEARQSPVPVYDTAVLHARAAAEWALKD